MKPLSFVLLFFLIIPMSWGDTFRSTIYDIEKGSKDGEAHLIKFQNARVAFLDPRDQETLKALEESMQEQDVLEFRVDKEQELLSVQALENGQGPQTPQARNDQGPEVRMSYVPTVLRNLESASAIFSKMKTGWQEESQCYNRAHVWSSEEFYRSRLNSIKVFIFFTNRYIRNYRFKWWFHVSPMVMVKEGASRNRRVLDRRYTSGPRFVKTWTDIFIKSKQKCPVVKVYSAYRDHQYNEDCYLMQVGQYYWQPRDIENLEISGVGRTHYIKEELDWAYWEAF